MSQQNSVHLLLFVLSIFLFTGCSFRFLSVSAASADTQDAERLAAEAYELLSSDLPKALEKAREAVALNPNLADAQKNLALAYYESGRAEEALKPAQEAVRLAPSNNKTHFVLGKTLVALGQFDNGIKELNEAIRLKPDYDKAYFVLGFTQNLLGNTKEADSAYNEAARIEPKNFYYSTMRDSLREYLRLQQQTLTNANLTFNLKGLEYDFAIYEGVAFQSLLHRNFDFLEKFADEARRSKQVLPGGTWLLQTFYTVLESPYEPRSASDYKWNYHLGLLKDWVKRKPESVTAKVALASSTIVYGWCTRGTGFANNVSSEHMELFMQRIAEAKRILSSVPVAKRTCPNWYSIMQQVALAEGWNQSAYDQLFNKAVKLEPRWYWFYKAKGIYLLPRWHGKTGEIRQFMSETLRANPNSEGALINFLVSETVAVYDLQQILDHEACNLQIKQGFADLQKRYGATLLDLNWAAFMAGRCNDQPFAREVFPQINDNWSQAIWKTKEAFDFARTWSNAK